MDWHRGMKEKEKVRLPVSYAFGASKVSQGHRWDTRRVSLRCRFCLEISRSRHRLEPNSAATSLPKHNSLLRVIIPNFDENYSIHDKWSTTFIPLGEHYSPYG